MPTATLLKNLIRRLALTAARLSYRLPSGLEIRLRDYSDWIIYNDVFVLGEYDRALDLALLRAPRDLRVLDLGANVGFFTLRAVERVLAARPAREISVLAFEGDPATYEELSRKIAGQPLLRQRCRCVHGLVGRRSGHSTIHGDGFSAMNAVGKGRGKRVQYLDLAVVNAGARIDLLKCDIEGSEHEFLAEYRFDLLPLVQDAVIESHGDVRRVNESVEILLSAGLTDQVSLRQVGGIHVILFSRPRVDALNGADGQASPAVQETAQASSDASPHQAR